jgi:hypothetical protein
MKQTLRNRRQALAEWACARVFLAWQYAQNKTGYYLKRPRCDKTRQEKIWDFVARRQKRAPCWIAIEHKGLVTPDIGSKLAFWKYVLCKVTAAMKCHTKGTFWISEPPDLSLNSKEKTELINVITESIVRIAPSLSKDQSTNLGPEIAKQFSHWPQTEFGPCELGIKRASSNGCEVRLDSVSVRGFFQEKARNVIEQDLCGMVERANDQLGLAKCKGAKETILLLDCDPIFEKPDELGRKIATLNKSTLANIDHVYLVPKLSSKDSYRALREGKVIGGEIRVTELPKKRIGGLKKTRGIAY